MANNQETKLTKDTKYNDIFEHGDDTFEVFPGQASVKELFEKVESIVDKINAIDEEQYAKTGITTAQANAITANTAKTGITTTQATQLSNLNAGRASSVATNIKNVTAQITQAVTVNAKTGTATLDSTILLSNGTRYTLSQALTKVNKK